MPVCVSADEVKCVFVWGKVDKLTWYENAIACRKVCCAVGVHGVDAHLLVSFATLLCHKNFLAEIRGLVS